MKAIGTQESFFATPDEIPPHQNYIIIAIVRYTGIYYFVPYISPQFFNQPRLHYAQSFSVNSGTASNKSATSP